MTEIFRYINIPPIRIAGLLALVALMVYFIIWVSGFRKQHRQITKSWKYFLTGSAVLILICLGTLLFGKLNWGLDFTGGTVINLTVSENTEIPQIRDAIGKFAVKSDNPALFADPKVRLSLEVLTKESSGNTTAPVAPETAQPMETPAPAETPETSSGENSETTAVNESSEKDKTESATTAAVEETTTAGVTGGGHARFKQAIIQLKELNNEQSAALVSFLNTELGGVEILKIETIGPTVGGELKSKALLALFLALGAQLIYITFRFGSQFRYGIAADIALMHDLILMTGIYTLAGKPIDSTFIAALLTIIGYSVMDTVVVFDRVRENLKIMKGRSYEEVVNASLNQSATRNVATSLTTILTVFAIYYFGGETLQNFAFALLIGLFSGTYSSIFVASPVIVMIDKYSKSKDQKRAESKRAQLEFEAQEKAKRKQLAAAGAGNAPAEAVMEATGTSGEGLQVEDEPEHENGNGSVHKGKSKGGRKRRR